MRDWDHRVGDSRELECWLMNAFLKVTTSVAQLAKELQSYNQMTLYAILHLPCLT